MASTATKRGKQLGELLQEQQEPFVLEAYLFERGCLRKSPRTSSTSNSNSSKSFKRSSSWIINKTKKGTHIFSNILRSVYNKLVPKNGGSRDGGSTKEERKFDADTETTLPRYSQEIGESDRSSSASSSMTRYESCCDSDIEEAEAPVSKLPNKDHASLAAEDTLQVSNLCNMKEERKIELLDGESSKKKKTQCKQQTQISVLEERLSSKAVSSLPKIPNKVKEDSKLSASLWELLFHPPLEKTRGNPGVSEMPQPVIRSNSSPQKSKRMLQHTRQLLFDCVREMTETHAKKLKEQGNSRKFLGADELGKLIYEKLRLWDKQAGHNETDIDFVLDSDFLAAEEWNCHEQEEEVCCEIGDTILEDIIKDIVAEEKLYYHH